MGRSERGRTVVDELVRDAEASAYAKRKFDEVRVMTGKGAGMATLAATSPKRLPCAMDPRD